MEENVIKSALDKLERNLSMYVKASRGTEECPLTSFNSSIYMIDFTELEQKELRPVLDKLDLLWEIPNFCHLRGIDMMCPYRKTKICLMEKGKFSQL